ncbi:hypothetical protein [Microcoleus sp. Z1_C3]|uniref:hypothetical protein n=1 Tax=unclassified Microcoleus TaxID=2642155 RepID=UPI002FD40577
MQAQLELLAEVEAVFATKNSNLCKFMQIYASWETKEKAEMSDSKQCFCDHKPDFYVQKEK